MKPIIEQRISDFRKKMKQNNIDTFLVLNEANRRYLSNYTAEDTGFDESAGALFISPDGLILATDSRFELQAAQEAEGFDIICYKTGLADIIPDIIDTLNTSRFGFESNRLSYSQYCKIKETINETSLKADFCPADMIIENLRTIKSEPEINIMKKALSIAESAFKKVINEIKPGDTEKEVAWMMEIQMRELGADGLSFPVIIASGPNSALPHAIPGDRKIKKNEPVLFDWGAKYNGYCSDTSRTLVIGQPDETFTKLYSILYEAQKRAIDNIRPGVSSREIDAIARSYIKDSGYDKKFGHGLGHGVGIEIHEPPRLSPLKDVSLESGMIVTVEPGIYLQDWGGIRLENMVLVTDNGSEVLNSLSYNDYII